MKKIIAFIFCIGVLTQPLSAADTLQKQTWVGKLNFGGVGLTLVLNTFRLTGDTLTATLDSPDQGAKGIPVSRIRVTDDSLAFSITALAARFSGRFSPGKDSLTGLFIQGGYKIPLTLVSQKEEFRLKRPQEPKPPYPYTVEEVVIKNLPDTVNLAGTLTLPKGHGPFPAIVLVSGSGPQNRNEEIFGHKPFLLLADYLTRQGYAVLRYDDRGIGKSAGSFATSTTFDFTADAMAAMDLLAGRNDIDKTRIGILGHSEGGLVAEIIGAERPDAGFIILLAGPALKGEEIIELQSALIARVNGESEEDIRTAQKVNRQVFSVVKKTSDNKKASEKIRKILEDYRKKNSDDGKGDASSSTEIEAQIANVTSPWFRTFLTLDPMRYIERIKCPVLAIFGGLDLQVPAADNMKPLETGLLFAGNDHYTIELVPGVNHLFQTATTGSPNEYGEIEETLSPAVLEMIGNWLNKEQ